MAITITATVGSATANSYATEAEAIAYMATRLNASTWTSVTGSTCTESEKQALVEAQRELTNLVWLGTRTDATQALSWPRQYVIDPDAPNITGLTDLTQLYYDDDEVPTRVKSAQIELAFQFLKAGTTDVAALDASIGVLSETVDVISVEYASPSQRAQGLNRYPRVMAYIAPLLEGSMGGLEIIRT